jgi:O-glycosyl hydrolase
MQSESVTFTPADTTDYTTVTGSVTVTVNQATPTVTALPAASAITYGQSLASSTLTGGTGSVSGTFSWTTPTTAPKEGMQSESVTFTPADTTDYTTVTGSVTVTVNQATPTITWAVPAATTYGTALSTTQLDASSSVAGTFVYSPASGTVLTAGSHTLSVTFTPTDSTGYNSATQTVLITVNKATPSITWATPAAITYGSALSSTQLDASSTVAGALAYTPASGTVLTAGSQTLSVTLTPTDTTDYNTATGTVTITVVKVTPTISWATPAPITYGTALSGTQLNASSTTAGAFVYTPASGTVLTAGSQNLSVTFTPTDTTDYNTATADVTLTVNKATPTVTWTTPAAITYGTALSATQLDASSTTAGAFVYTPASGTVLTAGSQNLSVTFTPADTTDYTTATGSVTVTVNQATTPTITALPTASAITYGQTLASSTLTGGTGSVSGTFAWTTPTTAPTIGMQSESVTFTPSDTTDYATVTGSVTVTVNQATPTVTAWPTASAITLGGRLSQSTLTGGTASANGTTVSGTFAFTTPGATPSVGTDTENVIFKPTDTTDYTTVTGSVSVTVNKATPTISTLPTASAIAVGQTLASSTLSGGVASVNGTPISGSFAWTTPSTAPSHGTPSESVTFTPTNTTNYTTVTGSVSVSVTVTANPSSVTVDFGTTYQTIRGFGGASVWLNQMPTAVAKALFSPTSGLNLSILRVRIGPQGTASGGGTYGMPYEYGDWDYELANGQEAVNNNPNAIVFATPWTPPASMKSNGSTIMGSLNTSSYADYANYLEDFVSFFNTNAGFKLYAVSMQNEPDAKVTYESCAWTPQQMDTWVANNASTITTDPYSTKLIMPESESFSPAVAAPTLNDPNAEGLVSIIGGHIYGVSPAPYTIPAGDSPKEIWMTEYGPLSNAQLTFAGALSPYGISIHNSMVNGQYNAYVWWGMFGNSTGSCATTAGTCGLVDNSGNVTVMGEVMGQYSKFIQPGYVRALATATPVSGVYVSAYTGEDQSGNQHYVIVAINVNSSVAEPLSVTLDNGSSVTSLTPYQSTSAAGLVQEPAVPVTSGQFSYTLPVMSITTLVQ